MYVLFTFLWLLNNSFLLKFAHHNLSSTEQFLLAVSLNMTKAAVRYITRNSDDGVNNTFTILESWRDSRTDDANSAAMFDKLSAACVNINRADLVEFVRCGE